MSDLSALPTATAVHESPPQEISYQVTLPAAFLNTKPAPIVVAQGAEAVLYRTHFLTPSIPCALKYRPPKKWRHPTLDARLTRHRILAEARILVKCRREGVRVPGVLALDWEGSIIKGVGNECVPPGERSGGWMMAEWVEGDTVRAALNQWVLQRKEITQGEEMKEWATQLVAVLERIGRAVGRMHAVGVIHGDLTTSNLMLSPPKNPPTEVNTATDPDTVREKEQANSTLSGEIVLIDFGLAVQAIQDEDRAVDLYVLERAYGSTHPTIEDYFQDVLRAYGESYKGAKAVLKRLEDVRMRGRKKSMLG